MCVGTRAAGFGGSAADTSIVVGPARRRSYCGRALVGAAPLPVLLLLLLSVMCVKADIEIEVFSLLHHQKIEKRFVEAVNAGFNASMTSRRWKTAPSVHVKVMHPFTPSASPISGFQQAVERNRGKLFVVVGPLGDFGTVSSLITLLAEQDVVAFAPLTGSSGGRGWNPNLYFTRASPSAELLALIRYALGRLRTIRLGFMYLHNVFFGVEEYDVAQRILRRMGYGFCGVFTLSSSLTGVASTRHFDSAWNTFVESRPQAVIVFAPPVGDTARFIRNLVADSRTRSAYVLVPSMLQFAIENMWREALAFAASPFVDGQVVVTGTNPLARDTQYHAIRRFQRDVRSYLKSNPGVTVFNASSNFDHDDIDGQLLVYGWITGEVLAQALSVPERLTDRKTFMQSLYDQRRYVIDDLVIGDYGGECAGWAAGQGAMCWCNQGGNTVHVRVIGRGYRLLDAPDGIMMFDSSHCYPSEVEMQAPFNGVSVLIPDRPTALHAAVEMEEGASLLEVREHNQDSRLFFDTIVSPFSGAAEELQREWSTKITTAVLGVVDEAMLKTPGVAFIDPVPLAPRLNKMERNVIHLSPTLEQQFYVCTSYLSRNDKKRLHIVIRSTDAAAIEDVLKKTLATFSVEPQSVVVLDGNATVEGHLPDSGDVYVIGLTAADPVVIAAHLNSHDSARVFVPFFDVVLLHEEFFNAFEGVSSADRVLFATNLPHWADEITASEVVQKFYTAERNASRRTPLSLLGFATAYFMRVIISPMKAMNATALVDSIFAQSVVNVGEMRYGPFADDGCFLKGVPRLTGCAVNYGATQVSVWSMARALNASIPPLTNPMTPSMRYLDPDAGKLSRGQLAGVIASSILVALLLVALTTVLLHVSRHNTRDNNSAPKEPTDPVTIVFTDIESSTAQWAAHPDVMADAVATHHKLIRALISQYECYEVKTVGDSFMIASRSAFMAVQLVRDLQRAFLRHNWGASVFDECYRRLEQDRALESEGYVPPTARLDPDVYRKLWNGLRVRVGVHTGLCDIRHDEVTKGYDYYGHTSNMAARTESAANGGQILLTRATYLSLSTAEREQLDVTALSAVPLRGVPDPVEMYQVDAVVGRSFAALRLDGEVDLVAESELAVCHASDTSSATTALDESSQIITSCFETLLGAFTPSKRRDLLLPICERWRVTLPQKTKSVWDDNDCQEVMRRIATKVGRVVDFHVVDDGGCSTETVSSASVIIISNRVEDFTAHQT
ncbi:expression site-associated gene 4 (ESAG4) protein, putative [Trypanosoma brucei gambiense DAL972]|uniref:adenylate cyclase n=1 Tax=Trypanosoma brucei gambiense (strain MHOM/CI/86/DAL972) TaxID=679716 RepID=D0A0U3_TRYB9|nr:expression site-associated gene 4 (ESAG4) protein, putative [Trypanosoma brucei gambiense DAL972]CBH16851.1 expression site-associated gene 4 (ESAG4) protein, putative [Trypanosoma brucei gambiense DAL972]|eukprot:XP_011779115.1 expression site-associated gene 4 (ESAG4) protein, putative [Trypanosoma brucei gambiense DAL972]